MTTLIKASAAYEMSEISSAKILDELLVLVNDEIAIATRLGFYGASLYEVQKLIDTKYEEYPDGFESALRDAGYEVEYYSTDKGYAYHINWSQSQ